MKKVLAIFLAGTAATAVIYLSRYSYLFKAIGINLKEGSLTPSTDDAEKFPYHVVQKSLPEKWKTASNYNQKILSERLTKDLKKTRASSLLVIQDGKIVLEQYWKDHNASSLINSFSMAKGILSILVGCAIADGYLDSEDALISSFFPQYNESHYGKHLTLKHLMTMQAGLDWEEEYHHPFAPNSEQYFVDDLAAQALGVEVKEMPGEKYEYQSVAAQLIGLVLIKATGKNLADYLSEKIWKPLKMESSAKWSTDEKSMEKAFCCIHATTRDFARIGQLILQNGNWEGKQLIDQEFCKRMLTPTKQNTAFCYTIWADDDDDVNYRFFYGFLGQFIIIIPEENLVIVKTGMYNRLKVDEKKRPTQAKLLVQEFVRKKQSSLD
ncbi:beta-lactamase family protein [Epilithonimonas sp. JDS]|uniref:serine hydrolase domain-containing protein n=1 Tax=Epilithonimonas sp. JDS TaxID=2902797 RepID=UPI001E28EF5D|nr:serine hydrolase [Epilithonimonas sp. JDS]MCD9854453.1 beta-lactamase family protein [Epilithonimonas sp. JDS]